MIQLNQIKSICIEATSHCNLHCPQCQRFDHDGFLNKDLTLAHLDFNILINNIDIDQLTSLKSVTFEGDHGDILMHPHARDMIEFFAGRCIVNVVTNGSLRSLKWWAELAKIKNVQVTFSIDGLSDTNSIYRLKSSFEKIIENAQSFINAGGHASWKFIVFKHNEHQQETARQLAKQLGFKHFSTINTSRSWWQGDSWPVKLDGVFLHNIHPASQVVHFDKQSYKQTIDKIKNKTAVNPEKNCWLTKGEIYINYMGYVMPCCMTSAKTWQNDIESKMWRRLVGNIDLLNLNHHCLSKILKSEFYTNKLKNSFAGTPYVHPTCISYCG
jgi:MoaA/NifB/PqqE/SkfB family radical SAM enzyme